MDKRGVIIHRDFKQRISDFSELRFGNITPTDLDAFMDFGNKLFVFVETKFQSAPMPRGQRLALERLVDACHNPPTRYSVGFLTSYSSSDEDINLARTLVREYRWMGKWAEPKKSNGTLLDGVNAFRSQFLEVGKSLEARNG